MIGRFLKILLTLLVVLGIFSCGGFTPPIPGPNQSPDPMLNEGVEVEQVPLEAMPSSGDLNGDIGIGKPNISADPYLIYTLDLTNGIVTSETSSTVTVVADTFEPSTLVDIFAYVDSPEDISSPPYIVGTDLDEETQYIQTATDENGGLKFRFVAGYSSGSFIVAVQDEDKVLTVLIRVEGPSEE